MCHKRGSVLGRYTKLNIIYVYTVVYKKFNIDGSTVFDTFREN